MALKLLVVDDDELDRMAIRRALRRAKIEADVDERTSALAALEAVQSGDAEYDCIVLDYRLPGATGMDVLTMLGNAGVRVPVVCLTGHGDEELAVEAMKAGAADYLNKARLSPDRLERSIRYAIAIHRAETERQSLLEREQRAREQAQAANRAKDEFLATLSHELRTPLNAILGFSDILGGEYFGKLENNRQREYVGLIRQSGAHLLSVVNTMLDMSKIEAGRYELMLESFPIEDSIAACEAMLALQAKEKGLTLTSRVQRGLGEIVADQRALQQILINLVGNAIKFTDAGGAVTVDAALADGMLKLSVGDTGIGIASERLASLGQPFVQIQNDYTRRYAGTGLGLSLVKGLVALHGGSFSIASAPGEGTVITILIPFDGSAALTTQQSVDANRPVDFPPRLKHTMETNERRNEEEMNGPAKAKIA